MKVRNPSLKKPPLRSRKMRSWIRDRPNYECRLWNTGQTLFIYFLAELWRKKKKVEINNGSQKIVEALRTPPGKVLERGDGNNRGVLKENSAENRSESLREKVEKVNIVFLLLEYKGGGRKLVTGISFEQKVLSLLPPYFIENRWKPNICWHSEREKN